MQVISSFMQFCYYTNEQFDLSENLYYKEK